MSRLFGTVAYGVVAAANEEIVLVDLEGGSAAAGMAGRRVAVLEVADLEALTTKVGEGATAELELAQLRRELDPIHPRLTAAGVPRTQQVSETGEQVLLLEDRIDVVLAERADLLAEVERLKTTMQVMGEGFVMVAKAAGYEDDEAREAFPTNVAMEIRAMRAERESYLAKLEAVVKVITESGLDRDHGKDPEGNQRTYPEMIAACKGALESVTRMFVQVGDEAFRLRASLAELIETFEPRHHLLSQRQVIDRARALLVTKGGAA